MHILRWLFKTTHDHSGVGATRSGSERKSEGGAHQRSKEVLEEEEEEEEEEDDEENKSTFTILLRRQEGRTCFYRTLHLKHLRSLYYRNQNFWCPENSELRMGHKADSATVGCKVLPICDAASTGSNGGDSSDGSDKDVQKGERRKAVSQMKELLKWAAAAKSHKGGNRGWKLSYFRNRVRHPSVEGISSTSNLSGNLRSSEYDSNMLASRKSEEYVRPGRWITTDSDFVVLEL